MYKKSQGVAFTINARRLSLFLSVLKLSIFDFTKTPKVPKEKTGENSWCSLLPVFYPLGPEGRTGLKDYWVSVCPG
jgi:hypothetical protein